MGTVYYSMHIFSVVTMRMALRISVVSALVVALALFAAVPALGATFKSGESVSLGQAETVSDDLYIASGNATVLGAAEQDVLAVAGNVLLSGATGADAHALGGTVQVLGSVGDDARIVGGQVSVGDRVGGDLVVAGGQVQVFTNSAVDGNAIIAGGRVVLDGTVNGTTRIWAEDVTINGVLAGDVSIRAMRVAIGEDARINGNLVYTAAHEADIAEGAVLAGTVTFEERAIERVTAGTAAGVGSTVMTLGALLVGVATVLVVVLLFGAFARRFAEAGVASFGKHALLGFAFLVVVPAGFVVLAITVLGLMLALIGGVAYALALLLAHVFSAILAGAVLSKLVVKEVRADWKWATLGVIVLQMLGWVPVVGWFIVFVFFLASLGALAVMAYKGFWVSR